MKSSRAKVISYSLLVPSLAWALWVAPWDLILYEVENETFVDPWEVNVAFHYGVRFTDTPHAEFPEVWVIWSPEEPDSEKYGPTLQIHTVAVPPCWEGGYIEFDSNGTIWDEVAGPVDFRTHVPRARAVLEAAAARGEITLPAWFPENDEAFFE